MMTRDKHLASAKKKALDYCSKGMTIKALAVFNQALQSHPDLTEHPAIKLGVDKFLDGSIQSASAMARFIKGIS